MGTKPVKIGKNAIIGYKEILQFISFIATVSAIVGFFWYLLEKSIHLLIELILIVIIGFLLFILIRLYSSFSTIYEDYKYLEDAHYERLALFHFLNPDPLVEDNYHRYTLRKELIKIKGEDSYVEITMKGHNACKESSSYIREKFANDAPLVTEKMNIKVIDNKTKKPIHWSLVSDKTYEKTVEIHFPRPLAPGDDFDITISCNLPSSFTRKSDYIFMAENKYKLGVNEFISSVVFDCPLINYELYKYDGEKFILNDEQPIIKNKKNKHILEWHTSNPKHLYLLKFVRAYI